MRPIEIHPLLDFKNSNSAFLTAILLFLVAALCYLLAVVAGALSLPGTLSPLWPGCAFLVAVLLCLPRNAWAVFLAAGLSGFLVYDMRFGLGLHTTLLLFAADAIEILVAAFGVSYTLGSTPRLNTIKRLSLYSLFAVLLAPAAGAFVGAIALGTDYWAMWKIGFFSALALANASGPQGYQSTGLWACRSR